MNNEQPAELQILVQLLGPAMGRMVFALSTLSASAAQMGQQIQQQAKQIQQMQQPPPPAQTGQVIPPASMNPFTGETVETNGQVVHAEEVRT